MICQNCGTSHGCGCQAKQASDGHPVCTSCIQTYEMKLKSKGTPSPNNFQGSPDPNLNASLRPTLNSITFNNVND